MSKQLKVKVKTNGKTKILNFVVEGGRWYPLLSEEGYMI
jgi:hypothetical protein